MEETRPDRLSTVPWRSILIFICLAFSLAWLVILPLWLMDTDGTVTELLAAVLPTVMMFTPFAATLVVIFWRRIPRDNRFQFLGVWPLRPVKRVVWFCVASAVGPLIIVIASIGVSAMFGWIQLDLTSFSGVQAKLGTSLNTNTLRLVMIAQIAAVPLGAVLNALVTFGEEIGWRGWLLPALRPLGLWPALVASGAIWGLWHAPVTLLGHNFNEPNALGVFLMTIGSIGWGVVFGWLRLRSGSLWPAVFGHGALNAAGGLVLVVGSPDAPSDLNLTNVVGVSGWIVIAVFVFVLVVTGQFKHEPQLATKPKG